MMKKKCLILGNCQAEALSSYFSLSQRFNSTFELIEVPGIYRMSAEDFVLNHSAALAEADLLIYQPLSDRFGPLSSKNINSLVSDHCDKISIPSLFFTGYNPEVAYFRDNSQRTLYYIDRIFLKLWMSGKASDLPKKISDAKLFPRWFSENCVKTSIEEAKARELSKDVTVPMSEFIENNFQKYRLFHVLNHPTSVTMCELSNRILKLIGIRDVVKIDSTFSEGVMNRFSFPIYKSHHKNLGLSFQQGSHRFGDENMQVDSYVDIFSKSLEKLSHLITDNSHNLEFSFLPPISRSENHIIGEMESELIFGSAPTGILPRILQKFFGRFP